MMDKLISQQAAINAVSEITTTMSVCTNKDECCGMKRMQKQAITELENLPPAEPEHPDINVGNMDDCISRKAAKDIFTELYGISAIGSVFDKYEWADICETTANELPSVQPTLYGYNIGHLELIARVLQKEDLPPERVVETLTDIGRIVAIVRDALKEKVFHNLSDEFYGAMQVLDELPSAQPEQRWIPCSERLPNKFEDVWVTDNCGRIAVCHRGHSGWRDAESGDWMYYLDSIVAWMPYYVPEPYQEGEQDGKV